LFSAANGGSSNGHNSRTPLADKWNEWIIKKHPELVREMVDELEEKDLDGLEMAALYLAAGQALIYAGSQLVFDTTTGVIYNQEERPYSLGVVLHNLQPARERVHDWVNHLFDQYTKEYEEEITNEDLENDEEEDDPQEYDSELEYDDDSNLDDDNSELEQ
jgi:hypothetical protein